MILAAGLTPAWQQTLVFDRFRAGEVNRALEAHWCASGKVVNVGIGLAHLGGPCRMLCVVGGATGRLLRDDMESMSISTHWIESQIPTRVCTTILDRATGAMTELVENASTLEENVVERTLAAFAEESQSATQVVLSGSLPPGTSTSFYRELMQRAPAGTEFVLDARGPELLEALPLRPAVVKPNREELAKTVGRELASKDDVIRAMQELIALGARSVVITHGAGPVLLASGNELVCLTPPRMEVVNAIGCGDSMAAGIAWALRDARTLADAVRFGMAAAADNVTQLMPARLDRQRVERILPGVQVERM